MPRAVVLTAATSHRGGSVRGDAHLGGSRAAAGGPEGKTAKNRVHLDVRVAGREIRGEERKRLVSEKVEQLVQAGASLAWETDDVRGSAIVLRDPEGNEFCVS
jgi:glyoxalase superfamily protein